MPAVSSTLQIDDVPPAIQLIPSRNPDTNDGWYGTGLTIDAAVDGGPIGRPQIPFEQERIGVVVVAVVLAVMPPRERGRQRARRDLTVETDRRGGDQRSERAGTE